MLTFLQEGLLPYLITWLEIETAAAEVALRLSLLAVTILIAYLLGSINSAILISHLFFHADIRSLGSRNAGATNMQRVFGWHAGLFTLLFDMLKTFLAITFAILLSGGNWIVPDTGFNPFGSTFSLSFPAYAAALFCILGHIFPLYYHFRGGKGILCTAVAIGMLSPWLLLVELIIFFGTAAMTHYVSLASIISAAAYPIFYAMLFKLAFSGLSAPGENTIIIFIIAAILVWAHRTNINRLRNGEEPRFTMRHNRANTSDNDNEEDYDL